MLLLGLRMQILFSNGLANDYQESVENLVIKEYFSKYNEVDAI